MENPSPEWQYWDREITDAELHQLANEGDIYCHGSIKVIYRVRHVRWNNRIKKRYRQTDKSYEDS